MKCFQFIFAFTILSLVLSTTEVSAQDCFDNSPGNAAVYNSTACAIERLIAATEGMVDINGDGTLDGPFNCNDYDSDGNPIDNDGDGLANCEEPTCDCLVVEICGDGIDNDNDGLVDCQDRDDCGSSVLCENDCGNGIDDDGDGFYDYYDGDCLADPDNPNDYIVLQPDCEAVPTGNVFSIQVADSSDNQTSAAMGMPMVADTDNDGTPEVITTNGQNGMIYVLDGSDLSTIEHQTDFGPATRGYPVVADVDNDGLGEIFIVGSDNSIKAYHHDLTPYWNQGTSSFSSGRIANVADFNLDGVPELYQVNEIRNATTGDILIAGSHGTAKYPSANHWQNELNPVGVAVDMFPDSHCTDCAGLELVVGHIIYSVDLVGNKLTEIANMNDATTLPADYRAGGYHPKDANFTNQSWSTTSVVDYNQDGHLDVLMGGTTGNEDGPTSVFFWDIHNSEVKMYIVARPGNTIAANRGNFRDLNNNACDNTNELCTWRRGLGTLNIANIDGDPELEVTFMSGSSLYALDQELNVEWENHDQFWESSSGFTGTTIFDFDGDGASEVIYRDEINLYIIDGITGEIVSGHLDGSFCSSQTQGEYPIVADVDGDGETEIIVSCGRDRNNYGQPPATSGTRTNGHIKVYKAANDNYWVPARQIWNQFSYFNVNINDNLSVPTVPQTHHLSFSQLCNDPTITASFSLNKFLNQSPRISYCGNLVFPAAKLDFVGDSTRITPPDCPDQEFQIRLFFENNGDEEVEKPIPISFYSSNPQVAYADIEQDPHFAVEYLSIPGGLQPGDYVDTTLTISGPRGAYTLYASLNDIGPYDELGNKIANSAFYPLTKLNGPVRECDDTPTIISIDVNPNPFQTIAVKLRDNRNCPGDVTNLNTGEVQVLAADSTVLQESEYDITWTNIATGDVVGSTALVTELDSGTYKVDINYDNGTYFCQGIADTVRVERFEDWPDSEVLTLDTLQAVSSCSPGTADGQARALLNGMAIDDANYLVEWEDEQSTDSAPIAYGDTATNLKPILYKVTVTNLLTGCSETETIDMTLDLPEIDSLRISNNQNCKNPNGKVTVQMGPGISTSDYDFMLIQLSPLQDTIFQDGPSFTLLDEGIYEVRAYDPDNECGLYTSGESFEIKTTKTIDDITIEVAKEQTACSFPYNGQLTAVLASGSNYSKYNWTWYRGTVTTGSSAEIVANDYITPDTLSTNLTNVYTVVAVETSSGCSFSESITLTESITPPVVTVSNVDIISHQTHCNPNGEIQVSVGPSNETIGYTFSLTKGSTVLATNTTGSFSELAAGSYSVEVVEDATNCSAVNTPVFEIEENLLPITPIQITETAQTNCDPISPNGAISVAIDGQTAGYSFTWYEGTDGSTPLSTQPSPTHTLTGVAANDYSVLILSNTTGCDTLVTITLNDDSDDYKDGLAITGTPLTMCDPNPMDGSATATLIQSAMGGVPDVADYTFTWYSGRKQDVINGAATILPETSATISNLDAGWYSVTALRNDGCEALDTVEWEVEDLRNYPKPNIQITTVENSSCDASNPNGRLEASIGGSTTGYTFNWYVNSGGSLSLVAGNTPIAQNLPEDNYYLEVIVNATNCATDTLIELRDNLASPEDIELVLSTTNITDCQPDNGQIEVTDVIVEGISTFDPDAYVYDWYLLNTTGTDSTLYATGTGKLITGLSMGTYSVVATNDTTSCNSIAWRATIGRDPALDINFTFTEDMQSSCAPPDGRIEINFSSGDTPADFTYQWYLGSDTTTLRLNGYTDYIIDEVVAETYTVAVTRIATGCTTIGTWSIPADANLLPIPDPVSTIVPSSSCDPYNGSIAVQVDPALLLTGDYLTESYGQDDFYYYWFEGTTILYENANPDPFHPDNYLPLEEPTALDNQSDISGLAPGTYTVIIVDVKDGVDNYRCRSTSTHTYVVPAEAFKPIVIGTPPVVNNTSCDPLSGNGSITIEADKHASDITAVTGFTFNWYNSSSASGAPNLVDNVGSAPFESTYDNLTQGDYTVQIVDNTTGCDTTIFFVNELRDKPIPPEIIAFTSNPQLDCDTQLGSIEITGLSNGYILTDHHAYWYASEADAIAETNSLKDGNTNTAADWTFSNLDAGDYWVVVENPTTACKSIPKMINVDDQRNYPTANRLALTHYTNCNSTGNGLISLEAVDSSTPGADFDIEWSSTESSFTSFTDPATTTSTISGLLPGRYSYTITNNTSGCTYSGYYDIEDTPLLPKLLANAHDVKHIDICENEGEITINEIEFDGATVSLPDADFTFEWRYETDDAAGATAFNNLVVPGGVVNNNYQVENLPAGTYYVWVSNVNGCTSERGKMFEIIDNSTIPFIKRNVDQLRDPDIICDGADDGVIEVEAYEDGAVLPALGYDFVWKDDSNTIIPSASPNVSSTLYTSMLVDMPAGDYKVVVTNNETHCVDSIIYSITERTVLPRLVLSHVADQTTCFSNGAATVSEVYRPDSNGDLISVPLTDFTYIWYTDDQLTQEIDPATDALGLDLDGQAADSLVAGTYYVQAIDGFGNTCSTLPMQVVIEDSTENLVVVLDNISDPIVACDPSDDAEGSIEVEVLNNTNYIIRWYEGAMVSNIADSLTGFSNSLEIEDLVPGTYTVWVQDTLTGCETTRTYNVEGVAVPITVSTSVSPFTNCLTPNGQIAVNANGGSGNYTYQWVDENGNVLPTSGNSNILVDLEDGSYTVQVSDQDDAGCETAESIAVVPDARGNMVPITVRNDFSVTNCDETRPNGQLTAIVEGEISRYDFFWYEGEVVSGNPIAQGATAAELASNTYSVVARDKVTGCISEPASAQVISEVEEYFLPVPTAELLNAVTRCENPDGSAQAILDSTQMDGTEVFEYLWYDEDGREVFRSTTTNVIQELAAGEYFVSVTNLVTGCYSESASIEIPEELRTPDFEIVTTPSTCSEATGSASIQFNENFKVVDVEWLTPEGYSNKLFLNHQVPGLYEVTVTDDKGCSFTQSAFIESTIYTYNGISPNGDGDNDKFIISCIENFDENVVRIYNRAGALVYENHQYDNLTSYFEGFGNRGLYIGGEKLPDGTYFYIIDKNNGDEPESGYLELMR